MVGTERMYHVGVGNHINVKGETWHKHYDLIWRSRNAADVIVRSHKRYFGIIYLAQFANTPYII